MKSSPSIWRYVVSVKSSLKISSMFEAFSGNMNFNWYYVVAFDPIKVWTLKAPQSDGLNLSFVKDFYVVAKKMAKNGLKMAIYEL